MKNKEAEQLLDKYLAGKCTPEELVLIKRAYNKETPENIGDISAVRYDEMKEAMWHRLDGAASTPIVTTRLWPKFAIAAASVVLIAGLALYFFVLKTKGYKDNIVSVYKNDIAAGGNKAILTLANGKTILLSSAKSGVVIKASQLVYNDGSKLEHAMMPKDEISGISTPRGGHYDIELPDGTNVALNAASTLKFPASFSGLPNRKVELIGEAYFEVSKNKNQPFIVKSRAQEVTVLGTHFNINSYPDETSVKTTLIEGSVMVKAVSDAAVSQKLQPGQQAELQDYKIEVSQVDVNTAIAWKSGDFIFNADIKTIMRQISRWYDVEVVYSAKVSNEEFLGTVSRSKSINEILKALELTKRVHFKVEGRRVTVMP